MSEGMGQPGQRLLTATDVKHQSINQSIKPLTKYGEMGRDEQLGLFVAAIMCLLFF